jgi:hypothetical protein
MTQHDAPAFPASPDWPDDGLTVRELLAAMAMAGLLACPTSPGSPEVLAADAVKQADALLAALAK